MKYLKWCIPFLFLFAAAGCYKVPDTIEPQVNFAVQDTYLKQLPPAFAPLDSSERDEPWGKEYLIAQKFAWNLDLYRAITAFKRAEFLLPLNKKERLEEIQYQIIESYYLGKRYEQVTEEFMNSSLYSATEDFPAYHDLLIIMYESYLKVGEDEKADYVLRVIHHHFPETGKRLETSTALIEGDLPTLRAVACKESAQDGIAQLLHTYETKRKSVKKAQMLNAFLPGAGFLYVGQKQSAVTSFLLNGLFIWASVHFYNKGNYAAGAIFTSFEAGWYFGGIYGAGESAKLYNERLYEKSVYPLLNKCAFFPVLMLKFGF